MNVTIVGGGLTGLTAAYYLGHAKPEWTITLYEQAPRFGGKIQTQHVDDFVVELGPDSYLGRKTEMTDLVHDLGLGDTLVSNETGQAFVYDKGSIHPIPGGSIMGIPTEMMPFVKATLISWPGKLRAGLDYFKKPYQLDENGDVSIGHFFKYHLGQEMMDKLIEPLLAGIYGGDIYKISLLSTFPHFIQVEQKYGNMVKGMMAAKMSHSKAGVSKAAKDAVAEGDVPRAGKGTMTDRQFESHEAKSGQANFASNSASSSNHVTKTSSNHQSAKVQADMDSRKGTAAQSGMFRQLTGGLESVITAIVEAMPSNVHLHTGTLVSDIRYVDGVYAIDVVNTCDDSCDCQSTADHVIISTPPATYRQWFKDDQGFDFLQSMEQSSCAIAIMSFDKSTFDGDLKGSGLLITRNTDTPLTACTILNQKWPQTTPDDKVVLRVFIGKPGNDVVERLSEEELSELAVKEIQHIMGFSVKPEWVRINRLIHCMPQYNVGHRAGIKAVREHVAEHYPNLHLIGTPFDGIGIPDGVKQAKELVEKLVNDK
ncbi:protoporphyrinogen oxidase [Veillonella parvula]|uniref:protoporphyrinogen oxidase n=1 Tax=Veillonella parvula TaxID=29466 RepID=UPI001D0713C1|nr:protoporphyrinogen oxidase [Veillonella parvula]MCB7451841.1 protoporphyrinogen oxidase [Veillonella parvula]MCQ4956330.1 protoporphyrinogen oxidase [Veillonella parvula]MCQ4977557.1 protoporphyrinogen oxidase [Veillonella parvula]